MVYCDLINVLIKFTRQTIMTNITFMSSSDLIYLANVTAEIITL